MYTFNTVNFKFVRLKTLKDPLQKKTMVWVRVDQVESFSEETPFDHAEITFLSGSKILLEDGEVEVFMKAVNGDTL